MTKGLTGIPSLSYLGVNAPQPPNITAHNRAPIPNDWQNFILGDLWLNTLPTPLTSRELWILVALQQHSATWIKISGGGGGGAGILKTTTDDTLIEIPDANGNLNVFGGENYVPGVYVAPANYWTNIYTKQGNANSVWVCLTRSIHQPITNLSATEGMYSLAGHNFLYAFGTNNTACGIDAQNLTLDVPSCTDTTAIGFNTLHSIFDGAGNTALGSSALTDVISGSDNIGIGYLAGDAYTSSESNNIVIGNLGVISDNNTIRLGIMGTGAAEQDKIYVAGIWNGVASPGPLDTGLVLVDSLGKLYVDNIAPDSALVTDSLGNPIGVTGAYGTVLTGMGAAHPDFLAFKPDSPTAPTVTYAVDPTTHQIILTAHAGGAAGVASFTTDTSGPVIPLAGVVALAGGDMMTTDGSVAHTATFTLTRGPLGSVIGANTGAASNYKTLTSSNGSLHFNFTNPATIDIINAGTPPVGGVAYLIGDTGPDATPISGGVGIAGGKNIYTTSIPGVVTVNVTDNVSLLGYLHAVNEIQTSTGSLIAQAGHLKLPLTDSAGVGGQIQFGGNIFISCPGTYNTFCGQGAGTITLNQTTAICNTFIGGQCGESISTGPYNTAVGHVSQERVTQGQQNTSLGEASLAQITTSSYNLALGFRAGFAYTGTTCNSNITLMDPGLAGESNTMRLGSPVGVTPSYGVGARQINKTYIAGVYGKTPGPTPQIVTIGSDGLLGTGGAVPSGGATTFVTDSGTATVSGVTMQVLGGYNVGTRGTSNIVTVDVDGSIQQNNTTAAGDGIYALGSRGASSYTTNRFMHNFGTSSTYLGHQAGPISGAAGVNCIGIGPNALDALLGGYNDLAIGLNSLTNNTNGNYNICIGNLSGYSLVSGGANCLYGYGAGYAYITETANIILGGGAGSAAGDPGVVGDTRTMYLGYKTIWNVPAPTKSNPDPVLSVTTPGTLKTYVYGIFNVAVDASATPVYVDKYGQLGTSGGVAFEYYLANDVTGQTGDNTIWWFGTNTTNGILTKSYDTTNSVTPGTGGSTFGSATTFTAPYSGKYELKATVMYYWHYVAPPTPSPKGNDSPLYIVTSNNSYMYHATPYDYSEAVADVYISETLSTMTYLDAGDTVQWAAQQYAFSTSKTITIKGVIANAITDLNSVLHNCFCTWITGHRID